MKQIVNGNSLPRMGVIGQVFHDGKTMYCYSGREWKPIDSNIKYCILCKAAIHPVKVDHPFFYNNLEYLEFKSGR